MNRRYTLLIIAVPVVILAVFSGSYILPHFMQRPKNISHPKIEYMLKPGLTRAGLSRTFVNSHHMRAEEADSYPVLVVGDSVMLGWARIDQSRIATSLLSEKLSFPVGNASANSWGPPNQLAYLQTFGTFDAEIVILVASSHDASDIPGHNADPQTPHEKALAAVREIFNLIRLANATPILALHLTTDELINGADAGYYALLEIAEQMNVKVIQIELPEEAYKDFIHPTSLGQQMIADQLELAIRNTLDANNE